LPYAAGSFTLEFNGKMKELAGVRVLIVEDDDDSREMYATYLTHLGMAVDTAANGLQCLERAAKVRPEIIVMDVSMPVMSGDEAVVRLRQVKETKDVPVVALTGYGHLAPTDRSRFDVFCRKPLLPEDLAAVLLSTLFGTPRSSK
jgi:CheY-like chemotaxis protein